MLGLLAGLGITVVVVLLGVAIVTTLVLIGGADLRKFVASAPFYLAILVLSVVGALAGGFTTARVTSGRSFYSVFLLAVILLVSGAVPWLRHAPLKPGEPTWNPILVAVLVPLGILLGGFLERRRADPAPTEA
jgi:hypothetical protein